MYFIEVITQRNSISDAGATGVALLPSYSEFEEEIKQSLTEDKF